MAKRVTERNVSKVTSRELQARFHELKPQSLRDKAASAERGIIYQEMFYKRFASNMLRGR